MEFEIVKYLFSIYHNRNKDVQLSTSFGLRETIYFFQLKEITKTFMSTRKLIILCSTQYPSKLHTALYTYECISDIMFVGK